jgi:drug/metabolite transporter (DMT)-like permease
MSPSHDIALSKIPPSTKKQSRAAVPPAGASDLETKAKPGSTDINGLNGSQRPHQHYRYAQKPIESRISEEDEEDYDDDDDDRMGDTRTPFLQTSRSGTPLLGSKKTRTGKTESDHDDEDAGSSSSSGRGRGKARRYDRSRSASTASASSIDEAARPALSRRSTMRSRSPNMQAKTAARTKYLFAAFFLVLTLVSFSAQTELAAYIQHDLGWTKAYCMLYLTHGSWAMLWPFQLMILRLQNWNTPWPVFWRRHLYLLRSTAHMVARQDHHVPRNVLATNPVPYMIKTTAFITSALTIAGLSWYLAVNMTSPSDLTAIYNCSAFFAYAFSVPLLKEKLRLDKSVAVGIAIAGVLVVAYGDSKDPAHATDASTRFLGNLIIGAGSVLYGLYEVLYKRWACPPDGVSAMRGTVFANTVGSCIGLFTLLVLWVPLPILHVLGLEIFELPTGYTAWCLWLSVVMNATFAGSFLVLISLTSPVLSSVASLLTIFIVAVWDWLVKGEELSFAAMCGGVMIVIAFLMLSWSTWREMREEEAHKAGFEAGVPDEDWSSEDEMEEAHEASKVVVGR